jgi:hypothetical protein
MEPSLRAVVERGPQAVIDQLSSNFKEGTLSDVQARDWYNSTTSTRADIISKMRAAGASDEEIAHEAFDLRNAARTKSRALMSDREAAANLDKTQPNMTWDEAMKKYNGNFKTITQKSLESNKAVNKKIEEKRAAGGQ